MITILLLVSCNKEERQITGNWIYYYGESYNNNNPLAVDEVNTNISVKITKNSWSPLIEGNCIMNNGIITTDVYDNYNYSYEYNNLTDEIKLKAISTLPNGITWSRNLKRQ